MAERLREAARNGGIDVLYTLMREDAYLLDRIDQVPFIDTPLHIAASAGHTWFAMEMLNLKPSFARKLNQDGFSPMHLALQNGQHQMVLRLLAVDADLVRVKGREGVTPLHFAAQEGMVDILSEFLVACPKSIRDLTIGKETALHIAAKNDRVEALEVLLGWLDKVDQRVILNWANDDGNTILHIAAHKHQIQVVRSVRCLMDRDYLNAKNLEDLTALDILEHQTQSCNKAIINMLCCAGAARASSLPRVDTLADFLKKFSIFDGTRIGIVRRLAATNEDRNAILVCAVLIATATFQAVINPPGGVRPDNNSPASGNGSLPSLPHYRAGTSVANTKLLLPFSIFNTIAFLFSVLYIWGRLPEGNRRYTVIPFNIIPLIICYVLAMLIVTPDLLPTIYVIVFILLFASVIKAINFYSKRRVNIGHCRSLFKRWPSFHREMKALT